MKKRLYGGGKEEPWKFKHAGKCDRESVGAGNYHADFFFVWKSDSV